MGLSFRNIKKWFLMVSGKSVLHVNQNLGNFFVPNELSGYFNNLTEKVTKSKKNTLHKGQVPVFTSEKGEKVIFPVAVFQYALGCYDLYLDTKESAYYEKFIELSNWAVENQDSNGGWNNFGFIYLDKPYGAMCQGEGASLLSRAFKETNNPQYLVAAQKALDFIFDLQNEHRLYENREGKLIFLEYEDRPAVLNGWIFALFGFYDTYLASKSERYLKIFDTSSESLAELLPKFDNAYWSLYDLGNKIASPFYHNLHIAQLEALYLVTRNDIFAKYATIFRRYNKKLINRIRAFVKKAKQKIVE